MILVAAVLLLVAVGLLAAGLAQGSATLQWGSFAASAVAALVLAVGELQRRRSAAAAAPADRPAATDDAATERADTALVVTPAPAEVPPGHDAHGDRAGGGAAAAVPPTAYDPQPPSAPSLPSAAHTASPRGARPDRPGTERWVPHPRPGCAGGTAADGRGSADRLRHPVPDGGCRDEVTVRSRRAAPRPRGTRGGTVGRRERGRTDHLVTSPRVRVHPRGRELHPSSARGPRPRPRRAEGGKGRGPCP